MCNLYSLTKGQQAIREMARAMRDVSGNLPVFPGIFPEYAAPIVRNALDCEFRFNPATDSDLMPAGVPI